MKNKKEEFFVGVEANAKHLKIIEKLARIVNWEMLIPTGEVVLSSNAWKTFGISLAKSSSNVKLLIAHIHLEDRARANKVLSGLYKGKSFEDTFRVVGDDKKTRYMRAAGHVEVDEEKKIKRAYGILSDITKQREAEDKIILSELRYRKLFEEAKDGVLLIDPLTEKIIDVNPYLLKITGYSFREVVGKKLWEIGFFKDIKATKSIFKEILAKKLCVTMTCR